MLDKEKKEDIWLKMTKSTSRGSGDGETDYVVFTGSEKDLDDEDFMEDWCIYWGDNNLPWIGANYGFEVTFERVASPSKEWINRNINHYSGVVKSYEDMLEKYF